MGQVQLSKIAKISCCVFIFYVLWFRYVVREMHIILYGSVAVAVGCMLLDVWISGIDLMKVCPTGVLINLVMCVYSLVTGVFVAVSQNTVISLVKTYATFSMICVAICYVTKEEGSIDWIIVTLIAVNLLTAVFQLFRGTEYNGYGYVLGGDQNPNQLGAALCTGLFGLAYISHKNEKRGLLYVSMAALLLYAVVNTGSRKSLIAGALICVMWLAPFFIRTWHAGNMGRRIFLVICALLVVGGIYYYFSTVFVNTDAFQRMTQLGDDSEFSSRQRKLYYFYAWDYFQEYPVFGIGLGQFQLWNPFHQMSHSTYAEALSCWGLVGSLIYFSPVVSACVKTVLLAYESRDAYVPLIILAVLVMEFFMGLGQVWFFEIEHLIVFTLVYYLIDDLQEKADQGPKTVYKYVKV